MMKKHGIPIWILVVGLSVHISFSWASNDAEYVREGYRSLGARSWDEAIDWYTKAIQTNPRNADAFFQRGIAQEMAEKIDAAVKDYAKTLELIPDHYLAMEYLAKLYEVKGDYAKAVDLYARALPLVDDPKWKSIVKVWLADAHRKMRQEPIPSVKDPGSQQPEFSSGMRQAQ